jgi:hypothetical protein
MVGVLGNRIILARLGRFTSRTNLYYKFPWREYWEIELFSRGWVDLLPELMYIINFMVGLLGNRIILTRLGRFTSRTNLYYKFPWWEYWKIELFSRCRVDLLPELIYIINFHGGSAGK